VNKFTDEQMFMLNIPFFLIRVKQKIIQVEKKWESLLGSGFGVPGSGLRAYSQESRRDMEIEQAPKIFGGLKIAKTRDENERRRVTSSLSGAIF